jgi:hypothetical protein
VGALEVDRLLLVVVQQVRCQHFVLSYRASNHVEMPVVHRVFSYQGWSS